VTELKRCPCCGEYKPLREFFIDRTNKRDGHQPQCKQCRKEIVKEYYRKHKRELVKFMGGKCTHCGLKPEDVNGCLDVFVVDEIKPLGIGKKKFTNLHKKELAKAKRLFTEEKTQLLCQNCSAIKTWRNMERRNSRAITY